MTRGPGRAPYRQAGGAAPAVGQRHDVTQVFHHFLQRDDGLADPAEAKDHYNLALAPLDAMRNLDALVLAVPHAAYTTMPAADFQAMLGEGGCVIDVKSMLDRVEAERAGVRVWRL